MSEQAPDWDDALAASLVGLDKHGPIFHLRGLHTHEKRLQDGTLLASPCMIDHDTPSPQVDKRSDICER